MNSISANLNIMIKASEKASKILIRDFGEIEKLQVKKKGPSDFVTNADLKAEKVIIDELTKGKPNFSILSEENGFKKNKDNESKESFDFIKSKLEKAQWFVEALNQRNNTLLKTMNTIVKIQKRFFNDGDENDLKPMILKDIAEIIKMDISTVSRIVKSKNVQTDYGIFPLRYFFSESTIKKGDDLVSSKIVKNYLSDLIENEDKSSPYSDDQLEKILKKEGYDVARRTVAKYREQLNIPVARLRKEY